jgi:hypothetical protein
MTVTSRRERREQQRRQEQRRAGGGGGSKPRRGGISQLWIVLGVVVLVVALILIGRAAGVFEPPVASGIDPNATAYDVAGQTIGTHMEDLGNAHVPSGQAVNYPSLPPTSGQHWAAPQAPAPWGVKTAWLPWEVTTHNLEHGGIVIAYNNLSTTEVDQLKTIVTQLRSSGFPKVVLEPYPDLKDAKVALTAWSWLYKLTTVDQLQIVRFFRAHYDPVEAPERGSA